MGQIGSAELSLLLGVVVLLFGAKKLPELARGTGQAIRIFKQETSGEIPVDVDVSPRLAVGLHEDERRGS